MLTGIDTGLKAVVNTTPDDRYRHIRGIRGEISHGGHVQLVAFFLNIIQLHDQAMDILGTLEVIKLIPKGAQKHTGPDELSGKFYSSRTDRLDVIDIKHLQDLLDLVGHVVRLMAQLIQIFPVNGRYKSLSKGLIHLMLFHIRTVFNVMHLLQHLLDVFGVVILQTRHEIGRSLLGKRGACRKNFKIDLITLAIF